MLAIAILLVVIGLIVWRLPKIDIGHSDAFVQRRWINWFPLGMTYAFLYMGRYNLAAAKDVGALTQEQYGDIFGWGALTYGLAFLINGPLTDRYGGRVSILGLDRLQCGDGCGDDSDGRRPAVAHCDGWVVRRKYVLPVLRRSQCRQGQQRVVPRS